MDPGSRRIETTSIDARMVRTRAALRAAMLALIERQPFDQMTIRDIVEQAGIGYATFFRHYPTKAALLEEVATDEIERLVGLSLPALDGADIRGSCLKLCDYVDEHRALWSALLTGGAAGTLREQFVRVAIDIGQGRRTDRDDWLPTDLGAIFGVSATVEILAWWLRQAADEPPARIAELLDRLVVTPTIGR